MTASEEHVPERRQDERRRIAQPAYYGENRTAPRRTDDAETDAPQAVEPTLPGAIPQQDYDFLTGLIQMEHLG